MNVKTELIVHTLIQNAVDACRREYHINGRKPTLVEVVDGLLIVWDDCCYHYEILNDTNDATFVQAIEYIYKHFSI